MRKIILVPAAVAAAVCAGLIGAAGSASAAGSGDTPATFTITGGGLAITAPTVAAALSGTGETSSVTATSVSGSLGDVSVTDARGTAEGWVVSAVSSSFETDPSSTSIAASAVGYTANAATKTGTVTVTGTNQPSLSTDSAVQTGSAASGNNTATWNPDITVTVPGGALVGAYAGTITQSVL
jgi:hypothetical protein